MLTAIDQETNESIYIDDYLDRLADLRQLNLIDPFFRKKVFVRRNHLRKNSLVRAHFVSRATYENAICEDILFDDEYVLIRDGQYYSNESFQHIEGKQRLINWAKTDLGAISIVPEYRIKITKKQSKYRVADVMCFLPFNEQIIIECQLSKISLEDLMERYYDYQSEGFDSLWFLGLDADTPTNRNFILSVSDSCPIITFVHTGKVFVRDTI